MHYSKQAGNPWWFLVRDSVWLVLTNFALINRTGLLSVLLEVKIELVSASFLEWTIQLLYKHCQFCVALPKLMHW